VVIVRVPLGLDQAHLDGWGRVPSGQWYGHLWWLAPAITTTGAVRLSLRCAGWLAGDRISLAYQPQSTSELPRLILDGINWPNLPTPWGTFEGHCHGLLDPDLPLTLPSGYQPLSFHYGRPIRCQPVDPLEGLAFDVLGLAAAPLARPEHLVARETSTS
jgi:hypothetical protein